MSTIETIKDFIAYLKKPYYKRETDWHVPFSPMVKLLFIFMIINIFVVLPTMYLMGVNDENHVMDDMIQNTSKWQLLFFAVILAPFLEEFIFRFHLRYKTLMLLFFIITSSIFTGYIIFSIFGVENIFGDIDLSNANAQNELDFSQFNLFGITTIGVLIILGILSFVFFISQPKWMEAFGQWIKNNFAIIFYLSAFLFGIAHVSNWKETDIHFLLTPLLVLPQLLLALYLGYIRVKNDIWSSIFLHGLNNLIPVLIIIIAEFYDLQM